MSIGQFVSVSILRGYSRKIKFNQVYFSISSYIFLHKESSNWKSLLFNVWIASRNHINPIARHQSSLNYLAMALSFFSFVCYEFCQSFASLIGKYMLF